MIKTITKTNFTIMTINHKRERETENEKLMKKGRTRKDHLSPTVAGVAILNFATRSQLSDYVMTAGVSDPIRCGSGLICCC